MNKSPVPNAPICSNRIEFCAIGVVDGLLTPIDKKWHSLKPKDPTLLENKDVQDWCKKKSDISLHCDSQPLRLVLLTSKVLIILSII
jgi:hypothetical protein